MKKICIFGGGSLYRLSIYNQMAKEIDCDFYIVEDDPSVGIKYYNKEELLNYRGSFEQTKVVGNFFVLKGALSLLKKDYDIYVLGGPFCLTYWLMVIYCLFSKKKAASWSHGMYGRETGIRKLIKIMYYKLCAMNFVYNNRAKKIMIENGIRQDSICTVYNSMDSVHDLSLRKNLVKSNVYSKFFSNRYPVIIFVGRVIKDKQLDQMIEAMLILHEKGCDVNFFVVGKDVDGVNLKDVASKFGVSEQVYLYGPCYEEEILCNFYYNASLCVSPGPVGLTAISSMSFGCPVISHYDFSHQGPEFESIDPGKTGDFFEYNYVEDLANVIKKLLDAHANVSSDEVSRCAFAEVDGKWNIFSETDRFKQTFENM